jgi:Carbohydrate esterase, sialic acid-specific acetylesterase
MKYFYLLLCIAFSFNTSFCIITLDSPVNNGVYQRDENGFTKIAVSGNLDKNKIDKIEYLLTDYQLSEEGNPNWIEIKNIKIDSTYFGEIETFQGWYKFRIRFWLAGKVIEEKTLERVGVGEVFVIVGQSNAAGDPNTGLTDASDERVVTLNNYYLEFSQPMDIAPTFSKITRDGYIGPSGRTAWLWGKLGDRLVNRLQIPVMFLNASFNGSSISNWFKTQKDVENNKKEYSAPCGTIYNTIVRFGNEFGIRSVLWFQGEADNFNGMNSSQYFEELKSFIQSIRKNTLKPNLGFVIARTSYGLGKYSPSIIQAQNWIIGSLPNVFAGPESDLIIGRENRSDDLHYSGQGLYKIAEAWDQSLTNDFFRYCKITAPIPETVKYRNPKFSFKYNKPCYSTNVKFDINADTTSTVKWNHEKNSEPGLSKTVTNNGEYWYRFENERFKSINSKSLYIEFAIQPEAPIIDYINKDIYCLGDSVVLFSNEKNDLIWNNSIANELLVVKNSGKYTLKRDLKNDCFSKESFVDFTFIKPLENITINSNTNLYSICENDSVLIKTNGGQNNLVWSNNSTKNEIYLKNKGTYWVDYKQNNGCPTQKTIFNIDVKNNPIKPEIIRENGVTLSANGDGNNYFWYKNDKLLANNTNTLNIYEQGTYKVYSEKSYKISNTENLVCKSEFSENYQLIILANEIEAYDPKISPNPIKNHAFKLNGSFNEKNYTIILIDATGKNIYEKKQNTDDKLISLPEFIPAGNYTLQLKSNKKIYRQKVSIW